MSARAVALAEQHREHVAAGVVGTPWHVYDAITGLAGIGRVLLAAVASGHNAEPGPLAPLDTLIAMARTRHGARPGWWLPADQHPGGVQVDPSGAATTGLAHGIAGPLALSLAQLAGYSVAGQAAAIREAVHWLLRWRTDDTGPRTSPGPNSTPVLPLPCPDAGMPGATEAPALAGRSRWPARPRATRRSPTLPPPRLLL
jgi:hypothetical protein